jgi:23S rRNA (guanine745-N1)-methyltransferase
VSLLICPVRGCGEPLTRGERAWACPRRHAFDVARSGYVNLLQPQDRRSAQPGDPAEAVAARRRLLDAGYGEPLLAALREEIAALALPREAAVLDVGCGEGYYLGRLLADTAEESGCAAYGVDLSAAAIDLAARRYPDVTWTVANADRSLPYATGSFDLVLSIDARLNPAEMWRVLKPGGRLLVAVPGSDDLGELRAAVLGAEVAKERLESAAARLAAGFDLATRRTVRATARLPPAALADALAATYRGGRESRRERIAALPEMAVTLSHDLGSFRGKIAAADGPPPHH